MVDSLRDFLKTFDKASKCLQIPPPKPKIEIGSTKSKDNLFAHYYNDINEYPNRHIRSLFRFGNNNSWIFSIKNSKTLKYTAIKLFLHILLTLAIAKFTISTRTNFTLQTCEITESNYEV